MSLMTEVPVHLGRSRYTHHSTSVADVGQEDWNSINVKELQRTGEE